jgi:hypothetical protein
MFAVKLIALVVAFMAVAQVDAKKRKHHKKERIRDSVTRRCGAETATIIIDGLSQNLK